MTSRLADIRMEKSMKLDNFKVSSFIRIILWKVDLDLKRYPSKRAFVLNA